jgi:hypothetical protein
MERLVDALLSVASTETGNYESEATHPFLVKVEKLGVFPPTAIIETNSGLLLDAVRQLTDWLGVGIRSKQIQKIIPYGTCIAGNESGVVGGCVTDAGGETYLVTCQHVLGNGCGSQIHPAASNSGPDAALLHMSPCFPEADSHYVLASANAVPESTLEDWNRTKRGILLDGFPARRRRGVILNRVHSFPLQGRTQRFPHLQVVPLQRRILGGLLKWPLFTPYFSKEGDSGSWVFGENPADWLGMVVAGDPDFVCSYVVEPQPLMEYFTLVLGIGGVHAHLSAQRYVYGTA